MHTLCIYLQHGPGSCTSSSSHRSRHRNNPNSRSLISAAASARCCSPIGWLYSSSAPGPSPVTDGALYTTIIGYISTLVSSSTISSLLQCAVVESIVLMVRLVGCTSVWNFVCTVAKRLNGSSWFLVSGLSQKTCIIRPGFRYAQGWVFAERFHLHIHSVTLFYC